MSMVERIKAVRDKVRDLRVEDGLIGNDDRIAVLFAAALEEAEELENAPHNCQWADECAKRAAAFQRAREAWCGVSPLCEVLTAFPIEVSVILDEFFGGGEPHKFPTTEQTTNHKEPK